MRRMHLKRRKKRIKINKIVVVLILMFISVIYILKVFNDKAVPILLSYSELETKKIVSLIVNTTITKEISDRFTADDLFTTVKDENGDIETIDFNSSKVNEILSQTSIAVKNNLKNIETGNMDGLDAYYDTLYGYDLEKLNRGIVYEVPSGIVFNNVFLTNIFPKIPVRISPMGDVICVLNTNVKSYGINNALIEVNVNIQAEVKILLPFTSSSTKIDTDVPIIMKIIEGNVPSYYMNGYLQSPMSITSIE